MSIEEGDYVTIGRNTLTWEVMEIREHESFFGPRLAGHLKSGQSGRGRAEWLDNLRLFKKGTP